MSNIIIARKQGEFVKLLVLLRRRLSVYCILNDEKGQIMRLRKGNNLIVLSRAYVDDLVDVLKQHEEVLNIKQILN